jgi:cell division septation protein DedD
MESIPSSTETPTASTPQPTAVTPRVIAAPPAVKTPVPAATASTTETPNTDTPTPPADAEEPVAPVRAQAPKPEPKPQRVASVNAAQQAASTASSGAGFVVQISSQKSEDGARASFSNMQSRFPGVLSGYSPSIKAVSLGDKGTFYRVRVGPMASRDEAASLCSRLKAAGGDCVVTPN